VGACFGLQEGDPCGELVQHGDRGDHVGVPAGGPGTQPARDGDHRRGGPAAEPGPDRLWRGDHQGVQLALGVGSGFDRGAAGGQVHLQRRPLRSGLGLSQPRAREGVAGGAFGIDRDRSGSIGSIGSIGIDRVGLGPRPAGRACGAVQLDHDLATVGQVAGQADLGEAITAAALHRPRPQPGVPLSQRDQIGVAVRVGAGRGPVQHRPGPGVHHGRGVSECPDGCRRR
jgi:hypothetical protein